MRSSNLRLALAVGVALFLSSCGSATETAATTGSIVGNAPLYEMECSPSLTLGGTVVELLGTSLKTTTDNNGDWSLNQVPAGYYTIRISKPGFTQFIQSGIPFVGAGTMRLSDLPSSFGGLTRINGFTTKLALPFVQSLPSGGDTTYTTLFSATVTDSASKELYRGSFTAFVGRTPAIDYRDSTSFLFCGGAENGGSFYFYQSAVRAHHGDTLYMAAYPNPCTWPAKLSYFDGTTQKTEFPGFGPPSNSVAIILP